MGDGMARNLIKGGREVVVWNRTGSKAVDFSKQTGCQTAGTPREVSARSCAYLDVNVIVAQGSFLLLSYSLAVIASILVLREIASARACVIVASITLTPTRERRLPESGGWRLDSVGATLVPTKSRRVRCRSAQKGGKRCSTPELTLYCCRLMARACC